MVKAIIVDYYLINLDNLMPQNVNVLLLDPPD